MKPPFKTGAIIKCFVSNLNGGHFSICSLLDCKWFTLPFGQPAVRERSFCTFQIVIHNVRTFKNRLVVGVTVVKTRPNWIVSVKLTIGQDN